LEHVERPNGLGFILVVMLFGAIGAQAGLHAIWCVFAPVACVRRAAAAIAAGLVWFAAWALGYAASVSERMFRGLPSWDLFWRDYWETVAIGWLCLPLLALSIQAPLWLFRIWLRWRIVHRRDRTPASSVGVFRIRHMFSAPPRWII
jgi:hypothetical protein